MKYCIAIVMIVLFQPFFMGCSSDPNEISNSNPAGESISPRQGKVANGADSESSFTLGEFSSAPIVLNNYSPIGSNAPEIKGAGAHLLKDRLNVNFVCTSSEGFLGSSSSSLICGGVPFKDVRFGLVEQGNMNVPVNSTWLAKIFDPKEAPAYSQTGDCTSFCQGNLKPLGAYPNIIGKQGRLVIGFMGVINPSKVYMLAAEYRGAYQFGLIRFDLARKTNGVDSPSNDVDDAGSYAVKECGITQEKLDDPSAVLFEASMTSFPIIMEGSSMGVNFRLITQAKLRMREQADQGVQEITMQVRDSAATGSGIIGTFAPMIVKGKGMADAKGDSGTTTRTGLAKKDWIELTNGKNPEYAGLFCAVTGAKSIVINKGAAKATVTFSPALVNNVSLFASIERMRKELGSGRTFNVTASVQGSGKSLVAGTAQGTTTIKEVSPTLTYMGRTITADIAWEIVHTFPGGTYRVGLPKRTVMYIDTANKTLKAIWTEDDKIDEILKKPLPPIIFVNDP